MASGFQSDGDYHIEINGRPDPVGSGGTGGSNNGGLNGNTGGTTRALVMYNGQMGYWERRVVSSNKEHDHYQDVFVPVGPSEAEKASVAAKNLQERQQAEAAAKAFADQITAVATAAELQRQQAIAAAADAGQYQSVSAAQTTLNVATAEANRQKASYDAALATAAAKRQAAINAVPAAAVAEQNYQSLLQNIKGMKLVNGQYGTEKREVVSSNKEHDHWGYRFYPSGISQAQVSAAQADAVNKRNLANILPGEASAAEQSSLQAAQNYQDAETRRQAAAAALYAAQQAEERAAEAERQRLAAEAAAAAAAEQKRLADEASKAAEEARVAAEQEKVRQARQAAADKLKSTEVQAVRGIPLSAMPSAFPLAWAVASAGGVSLGSDMAGGVWARITTALAELRGIATSSIAGPVAVTIAFLLYSRDAGTGSDQVPGRDITSLMPCDALSLPDMATLNNAADSQSGVSMPVRGRMIQRADGSLETQLVRTPEIGTVPVVRAVLDKDTGYWGYSLPMMPGVNGQTILVSPSDAPGVNVPLGLTGPFPLPETIVHTGDQDKVPEEVRVTVTPVLGPVDFRDLILIFPEESQLAPLYLMQSSPYGESTDKGKYSGRPYNPDKAGGPIQDLDWRSTVIDKAGIDKVKLHTGRFGESAANKVMIDRLEKILSGQLQVTDTDKRFYTHELRELERYRALGIPDNVKPDDKGVTWNNTHTATLEDYKINEKTDPLYTKDAEEAEFKAELKNN